MNTIQKGDTARILICAMAVMAFGWGYRGIVGHEGGAMLPGAMLGMAICLGSSRPDWHRRAAIVGLFAAVGWAWGGSISYMEHPKYVVSDSLPDVYYGYAMLFFFGALWAGIGGATLGMALTKKRSELNRYAGPFAAVCAVYLLFYLIFLFNPVWKNNFELFTVAHLHDGDWLAATLALMVSGIYYLLRPKDRPGAALIFWCSVAWWIGYGGLTKLGGIQIAPPYRSESWGGVLGIFIAIMIYLSRTQNRAARMLGWYGLLGGGFAFSGAVFIRHMVLMERGPFVYWGQRASWKIAEESFGLFMGLAIAMGAVRLIKGGLQPAAEDTDRNPLDVYAVFVMLIALMWVNLRRIPERWMYRHRIITEEPELGLPPWLWFVLLGVLITLPAMLLLHQYYKGKCSLAPKSAYGKGMLVFSLLLWIPAVGAMLQNVPGGFLRAALLEEMSFWVLAALGTMLVLLHAPAAERAEIPARATITPEDKRWRVGVRYGFGWLIAPIFIALISLSSMSMQEGPQGIARKRFGQDAYWRQMTQLLGEWQARGMVKGIGDLEPVRDEAPVNTVAFDKRGGVVLHYTDGKTESEEHNWAYFDGFVRIRWYDTDHSHPNSGNMPLRFENFHLYMAWPPPNGGEGYILFAPAGE